MSDSLDRRSFAALALGAAATTYAGPVHAGKPGIAESGKRAKIHVTILLYDGITMLDWVGPYEALHRVPDIELAIVGKSMDPMKSDSGIVEYRANLPLDHIDRTDVLIVPGGAKGMMVAANDPVIAGWIRRIDQSTLHTVGICTGSLLLSHLGLLKGRNATTYWKFTNMLAKGAARFVPKRWVRDGKYWTSSGVSAGIDVTLALIAELYGPKDAMMAQLAIEYDPHPPFKAGSVRTAPAEIVDALGGMSSRQK